MPVRPRAKSSIRACVRHESRAISRGMPPERITSRLSVAHQFRNSVVVDAVNPVPEARAGWHPLAQIARLVLLETVIADQSEHRRRVTARRPDLVGQVVPTWDDVIAADYLSWDDDRDGSHHVIDMTDTEQGVATALQLGDRSLKQNQRRSTLDGGPRSMSRGVGWPAWALNAQGLGAAAEAAHSSDAVVHLGMGIPWHVR